MELKTIVNFYFSGSIYFSSFPSFNIFVVSSSKANFLPINGQKILMRENNSTLVSSIVVHNISYYVPFLFVPFCFHLPFFFLQWRRYLLFASFLALFVLFFYFCPFFCLGSSHSHFAMLLGKTEGLR